MLHIYRQVTGLEGFRPYVLCRKRENAEEFPFPEKRVLRLPRPRGRELRRFWYRSVKREPQPVTAGEVKALLYGVLQSGASVVHVYFGHVAVHLLPFLRACPRPLVVSFHGADIGVGPGGEVYLVRLREVFRRADLVLARSAALLADLEAAGCPGEKLRLHRTGIPLGRWPFRERELPGREGGWRFVQACRLVEKKGLPVTLAAFAEVARAVPGARLVVAGDGPLRPELEAESGRLGLGDRVEFTGFVGQEGLKELVYGSHVFVHPSQTGADGNREGVPNAMLEAMASGLPVLATKHGGIPEAVGGGEAGFLVDEGDAAGLARAALRLVSDPSAYRAMARAARAAVEEKFEQGRQCRELESHYREAIGRREETEHARYQRGVKPPPPPPGEPVPGGDAVSGTEG